MYYVWVEIDILWPIRSVHYSLNIQHLLVHSLKLVRNYIRLAMVPITFSFSLVLTDTISTLYYTFILQ